MKFACTLTVADYLAAQRLHFRPKAFGRIVLYFMAFCGLVGMSEEVWIIIRGQALPHGWWMLPTGVAYGALLFFLFLPWKVAKIFRANPRMAEPLLVTFSEDGLLLDSPRGQVRAPWSALKKWKVNDGMILVYHSGVHFHIFPRRGFSPPENFAGTMQLLTRRLGVAQR